jgi:hypothetical protein
MQMSLPAQRQNGRRNCRSPETLKPLAGEPNEFNVEFGGVRAEG